MSEGTPDERVSTRAEWAASWRVVLASAVGASSGLILYPFLSSLFIRHHTAAFDWTRGEASFGSIASLCAGLLAPLVGRLADTIGVKPVIVFGALGFAASCIGLGLQNGNIWLYYGLIFFLVFFGLGTTSIAWARPITAVFVRSRGLALSVALSSVTLTAALTPPLLSHVISTYGWRAGWMLLAAMALATAAVGLMLMPRVRPRPEAVARSFRLGAAARQPAFWCLVGGMFIINIPSGGLMNQMAALIGDKGFDDAAVASTLSAFAISVFAGRLIAGVCLDRFPPQLVTFLAMALPAAGCLLLLGQNVFLPLVITGIALAGLSQGAEGDVGPFLIARYFGLKAFGALMGCVNAAVVGGTAVGGILFAQVHDATRSYDLALWVGAGCFLAGACCFAMIGATRRGRIEGTVLTDQA